MAALEAARAGAVSAKAGAVLSNFVSPVDGLLKVHYLKAERQGSALDASALLQAEIQRAGGSENYSDPVLHRFPSPLQSSNADCTDDWYSYGEGPFTYTAPSQPGNVSDAWVFSLSCSSAYAQQSGVCETTNQGSGPGLIVLAWTFLGDEAFERSFLRFDLGGFPPVIDSLAGATLRLTPWNEPPAGDNAFHISKVSQAWSETAVTWLNQPSVTTPTITVPSGSAPVSASVTPIVQDWITNPSTNYGIGLRLVTEQYYRRYYFASSDNTDSSLRPGLTIDFANPDGEPLAEYVIAPVSTGEETTFSYLIDGIPVSPTTQTATTMTIGGVEHEGQRIGFGTGTSCPSSVGYHNYLEVFAYVDTLTTVVLEFDRDPATYLPMKGDSIRVTARITPEPPQGSEVVFRLASVDSVRFRDTELDSLVVPVMGDSASAKLWSYAYWGVADLTVTYQGPEGEASDAGEIPIDADDDGIADSWEMSTEGGGTMHHDGYYQDQEWDEEVSPGTANHGDYFSKEVEYRGYILGTVEDPSDGPFSRMKANRKEFLLGIDPALVESADTAITLIGQQLGIEAVDFVLGADTVVTMSDNSTAALVTLHQAYVKHDSLSGVLYVNCVQQPRSHANFGGTLRDTTATSTRIITIYRGAIANIWNSNYCSEGWTGPLPDLALPIYQVAEKDSLATWHAAYDGKDQNGMPGTQDINPFDVAAHHPVNPTRKKSMNNNSVDSIVGAFTEDRYLKLVILHELGHALGMYPSNDLHPSSGITPMRGGIGGPGHSFEFTDDDKTWIALKW